MRSAVLCLGLLFTACAGQQRSPADRLQEAVEAYNHAFRWKNYERAAMFIPADLRESFVATYADDEASLQVEDYSIRSVDWQGDSSAKVSVRVSYLLLPSVTVQSATLVQHWEEIDGNWMLETEDNSIRKLKDPGPEFEPTGQEEPAAAQP